MKVKKPFKQRLTVTESVAMEAAADRIDEAAHVVKGVKVIGRMSAHGYEYSPRAVSEAAKLYENARVYVGHRRAASDSRTGSYGERLGVLKNFTATEDGGFADLHYNPHHPQAAQFIYDVRNTPDQLGFSHHADIRTATRNGKTVVESIDKLHSVDLVNVPATTKGVFESEDDMQVKTLRQLLDAAEPKSLTVLEDMLAGGGMSESMPVEVEDGAGADAQIKAAFRSAVIAAFDDDSLDSKATLAKIKDILNAYDKLTKSGKKDDAAPAGDSAPATESVDDLKSKVLLLERREEVRSLAAKSGVELTDITLKAATALESVQDRAAFVASLPKAGKSGPDKPGRTTTVMEAGDDAPAVPTFKSNEERLAYLRGN